MSRCDFPIEHGDFPASYVSLPEGNEMNSLPLGVQVD